MRRLTIAVERFPIAGVFTIARGSRTEAVVVTATIECDGHVGRGECVPYARYGESVESVVAAIEAVRTLVEAGAGRQAVNAAMPAGAARNAVDCALFDLDARIGGTSVAAMLAITPRPLVTAYTISLARAEDMARRTRDAASRPLLKVKVGTADDIPLMEAVAAAAPESALILDANEGWTDANLEANLEAAARLGYRLVEQPLPAGKDRALAAIARPIPVCADESVHTHENVAALRDRYDAVNIKLDKTGGLTGALALKQAARDAGFRIMVGCMVGTSLAMAPATLLATDAEWVDLDGPLLLARDRVPGLVYEGSLVRPPEPALWG